MPSLDGASHPLLDALQQAFSGHVEDDLVDLVAGEDDEEQDLFEVQADDWTLVVEGWPLASAWIAIENDTESPEQFRAALEATLSERDIESLEALNTRLSGDLATTLHESGDGISMALSALLAANVE